MCKNCKCQECNPPPPPPSVAGQITTNIGAPIDFEGGEIIVSGNTREDGKNKITVNAWAKVGSENFANAGRIRINP